MKNKMSRDFLQQSLKHFGIIFALFFISILIMDNFLLPDYPFVFTILDILIIALAFVLLPQYSKTQDVYHLSFDTFPLKHPRVSHSIAFSLFVLHIIIQVAMFFAFDFITFDKSAFGYCIFIAVSSIMQEVLFRGFLFKYLYQYKKLNYCIASLIVCIFFAIYHREKYVLYFVIGMYDFVMFYFWRSLAFMSVRHIVHNMIWIFFPFDEDLFEQFLLSL